MRGSPGSPQRKSIAHSNGFRRETIAPTPLEESAIVIMTGFNSAFEALGQAYFDDMSTNPLGLTTVSPLHTDDGMCSGTCIIQDAHRHPDRPKPDMFPIVDKFHRASKDISLLTQKKD